MTKDPAFLFYTSDFLTGTLTMPFEDRGKYITILSLMHQQGRLPEETIRFLVGSVSDSLRAKFSIDKDGLWFNERLEIEIEKRKLFTESRRLNGQKGGRKPIAIPTGMATENHTENENENENESIDETKKGKRNGKKTFTPPTLDEVILYFRQRGYTEVSARKAHEYYDSADWKDSTGKPVLSWKQKMISVWFKDENKDFGRHHSVSLQNGEVNEW